MSCSRLAAKAALAVPTATPIQTIIDLRDGAQSLEALIACNAIGLNVGPSDGRPAEQIFGSFVPAGFSRCSA